MDAATRQHGETATTRYDDAFVVSQSLPIAVSDPGILS